MRQPMRTNEVIYMTFDQSSSLIVERRRPTAYVPLREESPNIYDTILGTRYKMIQFNTSTQNLVIAVLWPNHRPCTLYIFISSVCHGPFLTVSIVLHAYFHRSADTIGRGRWLKGLLGH